MTVNSFIEKIVEKNPNQIVTIYDDKHNIIYHGKADFAPLTLWFEYRNSQTENCIDINGNSTTNIIINGDVEETTRQEKTGVKIMKTYYVYAVYECKSIHEPETARHCYDVVMTPHDIAVYVAMLNKHLKEYICFERKERYRG